MAVTLEIAGRAVSRLGNAAVSVPVVVRNAITLASAWSGATDSNGYFTSALLEDANEYRAEVEYDTTNHYKTLRDLASGQMNMLQVRKRFHVHGAATPCIIDGNVSVGGALVVAGGFAAAQISIGAQTLDARFSAISHAHDAAYVNVTGDTVSGQLLINPGATPTASLRSIQHIGAASTAMFSSFELSGGQIAWGMRGDGIVCDVAATSISIGPSPTRMLRVWNGAGALLGYIPIHPGA